MPELPDLTVYLEHIERRLLGERLEAIRLVSPFVLRTVTPSVEEVRGQRLLGTRRLDFDEDDRLAIERDHVDFVSGLRRAPVSF